MAFISRIAYNRVVSDGNFGNDSIRAEMELNEQDDAAVAAEDLRKFVNDQVYYARCERLNGTEVDSDYDDPFSEEG